MWVLVFIYFYEATPYVEKVSVHNKMTACFFAREALSEEQGGTDGYFPLGQQAICIKVSGEEA